jgi:hypothetical protein
MTIGVPQGDITVGSIPQQQNGWTFAELDVLSCWRKSAPVEETRSTNCGIVLNRRTTFCAARSPMKFCLAKHHAETTVAVFSQTSGESDDEKFRPVQFSVLPVHEFCLRG